jgi:hypothetical protein
VASDIATYLIRSLLSEGRICYELVEKTKDGMRPRLIEKEGYWADRDYDSAKAPP